MVSPGPLLLAGGEVVVREVQHAGLRAMIVATKEIFFG